jgi:hypothetical protein
LIIPVGTAVTDLFSDAKFRAAALRFCLALCKDVYQEERDEREREREIALLDLQREVAAHGLSWDEIADPLAVFLLEYFSGFRVGVEAGHAMARHGPQ